MQKVHQLAIAAFAVIILGSLWFPVAGQQRPREDVLDALLVEVRGLRGAIEHMASASARVQLITSRLQLQEQRLNTLLARLSDQRDRLGAAERELAGSQQKLAYVQEAEPRDGTPQAKRDIDDQIAHFKWQITQSVTAVERLRADEAELATLVGNEQTRWTTINKQLEELEAALRR